MTNSPDYHDFKPILVEIEERPAQSPGDAFPLDHHLPHAGYPPGSFPGEGGCRGHGPGKIIPLGDVKVVQPLETGVVTNIHVREGDYVKKGAILLEIDPSIDKADLEGKERNLQNSRLAMERVNAVLGTGEFSPSGKSVPQDVMKTQTAHYHAQKNLYDSTLREKEKEYKETQSALKSLTEEIGSLRGSSATRGRMSGVRRPWRKSGALADNRYREKLKERMNLEKELDVKISQADQTTTKLERIRDEIETFKHSFEDKLLAEFTTNLQTKNTLAAEVESIKFKQGKNSSSLPWTAISTFCP